MDVFMPLLSSPNYTFRLLLVSPHPVLLLTFLLIVCVRDDSKEITVERGPDTEITKYKRMRVRWKRFNSFRHDGQEMHPNSEKI